MTDLFIYGAGGLGREIASLVKEGAIDGLKWNLAGFIDDAKEPGAEVSGLKVVGGETVLSSITRPAAVVFGFADPHAKERLYLRLSKNPNIEFPTLIHPLARVDASATLADGVVITQFCSVAVDAVLGRCAFMNVGSMVGHDTVIGDFCTLMPHADVVGGITVGPRSLVGLGAKVLQGLSIGADSVVGIGSVVISRVPDGVTVMGNPARVVRK
ncbi:MAG: NeuD/PglB/VioB family sugar acetyltransferase [Synergistaceae bacterium]|jgi:sugar O-acyltransferase (sialic acid O-acetyltransferase NeuD family)|nr:NeuD/PglB/VioB family sugar acetyltransferase [Synergistaceae bacterium]